MLLSLKYAAKRNSLFSLLLPLLLYFPLIISFFPSFPSFVLHHSHHSYSIIPIIRTPSFPSLCNPIISIICTSLFSRHTFSTLLSSYHLTDPSPLPQYDHHPYVITNQ